MNEMTTSFFPVIDDEHLNDMTGGDAALRDDTIRFFIDNARTYITALSDCVVDGGEAYRAMSHKLKGASRSVGAVQLAELAEASEALGAVGPDERVGMVSDLWDALRAVESWLAG